jgi:hypothetical protein
VVGPATSTAQPVTLMWAAKATTRREGPRSRVAYHEGKGTYIDLGRKETPSVGRPHKGRLY